MLKKNPKDRLSAKEVLNHPFFTKMNSDTQLQQIQYSSELKSAKVDMKKNSKDSFVVRDNLINGHTDTIKENS